LRNMCITRSIFPVNPVFASRFRPGGMRCLVVLFLFLCRMLPGIGLVYPVYAQASTLWPTSPDPASPPVFTCHLVHTYPHDPAAFTQGLVFEAGFFFEGTGLNGRSSLRKVTPASGKIVQQRSLPHRYFGEGVTVTGNRLIQLTWRSNRGFVYDKQTFQQIDTFHWPSEGWGITANDAYLIVSDGTDRLFFLDPETFKIDHFVSVHDRRRVITRLNELEFVEGFVLANIWQEDRIAVIAPETGEVAAWIQLGRLAEAQPQGVPNGIAYDRSDRRLFVTGKRWSRLYEIVLILEK